MIRPFTLLTALLAIGSGYYLYQAKHRTKLLDERIASVEQQQAAAESGIAVLRAEWALENSPSRLADLAAHYLLLTPMQPSQAVSMANLASHLPPPGSSGAAPPPESEPDVAALAGLPRLDLYAGLEFFSPESGKARLAIGQLGIGQLGISQLAAEAAPVGQASPAAQPSPARQPVVATAGATGAKPAGSGSLAASPAAAPVVAKPVATKILTAKTARPAVASRIAERAMPTRREPTAILTSALGGAYPNLAPPAPLSGSH